MQAWPPKIEAAAAAAMMGGRLALLARWLDGLSEIAVPNVDPIDGWRRRFETDWCARNMDSIVMDAIQRPAPDERQRRLWRVFGESDRIRIRHAAEDRNWRRARDGASS
jgi:hypothetical protein